MVLTTVGQHLLKDANLFTVTATYSSEACNQCRHMVLPGTKLKARRYYA